MTDVTLSGFKEPNWTYIYLFHIYMRDHVAMSGLVSSVAYLSLEYMLDHDRRNSLQTTERGNSHQFKELR